VAEHVDPTDVVYLDQHAMSASRALIRLFGDRGELTLVTTFGGDILPDLLQSGAVSRVVASSLLNRKLAPSKVAAFQSQLLDGTVAYEPWSLYALAARMQAAALGWPFVPTRGLVGSSIADGNPDVSTAESVFGDGETVATTVLKPLAPDVAIVHAMACDPYGRALITPPYTDGMWGARASRKGVIVTTERVLSTEQVRRFPRLRMLPAGRVLAVCHSPFGAHPFRYLAGTPGLAVGYFPDSDVLEGYSESLKDNEAHRAWIDEWVVATGSEEGYRHKVGRRQQEVLRRAYNEPPTLPTRDESSSAPQSDSEVDRSLTSLEPDLRMSLLLARRLVRHVLDDDVQTILVGAGPSFIGAGLARLLLGERAHTVEFLVGTGIIDVEPSTSGRTRMVESAGWLSGVEEGYGVALGGPGTSLALLSAAQLDRHGNLNSSFVGHPPKQTLLAGSGGANDATSLADLLLVVARHRRGRFVADVDYVMCPGDNVSCVVTDFGVLEKRQPDDALRLTRTLDGYAEHVLEIAAESGWEMGGEDAEPEPGLSDEELQALHDWGDVGYR
jgi:acyl CoA:acetate/3-ketoacid CoA transferase alpha subunit/acyl CoA:acetate/3-ketoacid CoA transferase beta subunit